MLARSSGQVVVGFSHNSGEAPPWSGLIRCVLGMEVELVDVSVEIRLLFRFTGKRDLLAERPGSDVCRPFAGRRRVAVAAFRGLAGCLVILKPEDGYRFSRSLGCRCCDGNGDGLVEGQPCVAGKEVSHAWGQIR